VHEYVGIIEAMHPATLHGVGVITKLYFAIFEAFKELINFLLFKSAKYYDGCADSRKVMTIIFQIIKR